MNDGLLRAWVALVPGAPALAFAVLGLLLLAGRAPSERGIVRLVAGALTLSFVTSLGLAGWLLASGREHAYFILAEWFVVGHHTFELGFWLDSLALTMMVLTTLITALIGHFSVNYLHRDPGFARFYLLLALFASGMLQLVMGATVDQLLVGWELVGLSSALLVGYFHRRAAPVEAGLRVFVTYRICDIGLLVGAVLLHEVTGTADLREAFVTGEGGLLTGGLATVAALSFLLATLGKSAQIPVGSWLPRAMEGPTPSSALFYGGLSVHAGVYLLLRLGPLFEASPVARAAVVAVGAATALHAALISRVQTDVKSTLAYATQTQVGVMFVTVGLGFPTVALVHLVAHASLRAYQLLRAPSALLEAEALRAAGVSLRRDPSFLRVVPSSFTLALYRLALQRFHLEALQERLLIGPVRRLALGLDHIERRWVAFLSGRDLPAEAPAAVLHDAAPTEGRGP